MILWKMNLVLVCILDTKHKDITKDILIEVC